MKFVNQTPVEKCLIDKEILLDIGICYINEIHFFNDFLEEEIELRET